MKKQLAMILSSLLFLTACGESHSEQFLTIEKQAQAGDVEAQYQLGRIYDRGLYDENSDLAKAANWYDKAANQGHKDAQFNLAHMYMKGEGVEKDIPKAIHYFELSAEQGDIEASYNLGTLYADLQQFSKARPWLEKAIEKGHLNAMNNLAMLYINGWGVPQDIHYAKQLLEIACRQGSQKACDNYNQFIR